METPEHLIEQAFVFRLAAEQSIDPDNELVQDMQLSLIKEEYEELVQSHINEEQEEDKDLDNLRNLPEFKQLLNDKLIKN